MLNYWTDKSYRQRHTVRKILKATSESTDEIGDIVEKVYTSVIIAGTHYATSIKWLK